MGEGPLVPPGPSPHLDDDVLAPGVRRAEHVVLGVRRRTRAAVARRVAPRRTGVLDSRQGHMTDWPRRERRQPRTPSNTIGSTETNTITSTATSRLSRITEMPPRK